MPIRQTILRVFADVAREQHKTLAPLTDDAALLELGLDSLCIAVIVARLGEELERDPFAAAGAEEMPTTFGAFVALYENAAG